MPAAAEPKPLRLRERRLQVLDAARSLFFKKGYRGTTIQQIAARAGYSKRTVYLDYDNKDDLFMALCAEGAELLLLQLQQVPGDQLAIEDGINQYLDIFVRFSRDNPQYFHMIFSEATPDIVDNCSDPVRNRIAGLERACLGIIVAWTERAMRERYIRTVDPWETAGIFVGTATGIILLSMGGSQTIFSREALEGLVKKAIWTFWQGLRVPTEPNPGGSNA